MNWLAITDKTDGALEGEIARIDKGAKIASAHSNDGALDALGQALPSAQACVISAPDKSFLGCELMFALGVLAGNKVPVFSTVSPLPKFVRAGALVKFLKTEELVVRHIEENFSSIERSCRKKEAFKYLFDNGIPFTVDSMASCVAKGDLDTCKKYALAGMDLNSRDKLGTPLLNTAVRAKQIECVEWLLDNGADIRALSADRGYSALMDAVWIGDEAMVKLLIERGSEMNIVNKEGQTMLVLAVGANRKSICRALVERGESPDIKDSMGMSAYGYAKLFKKDDFVELFQKYHKE